MTDVVLDGANYISARRASEISGYSRDYIGQLARAGKIAGKRIGGLWYILEESLRSHKSAADAFVPVPPRPPELVNTSSSDSIIGLDGSRYVSASQAAKTTGYHQDYIGQLAREGKILSKQVGQRWFVEISGLSAHKDRKDALLASVQRESVGLPARRISSPQPEYKMHFIYSTDSGHLLPPLRMQAQALAGDLQTAHDDFVAEQHAIPIRVIRTSVAPKSSQPKSALKTSRASDKSIFYAGFTGVFLTVVVVLALHINLFSMPSVFTRGGTSDVLRATALATIANDQAQTVSAYVQHFFGTKVTYDRSTHQKDF